MGLALRTISRIEAGRIVGIHCTKDSSGGGEARKDKADMIPSYASCMNIVIFWVFVDDVLQFGMNMLKGFLNSNMLSAPVGSVCLRIVSVLFRIAVDMRHSPKYLGSEVVEMN